MAGGSLLRRAKKVICRGGSSSGESSRVAETTFNRSSQDSQEEDISDTQEKRRKSNHVPTHASQSDDGIWLIDVEGAPIRRRGRTTCADIQNLPPDTKVHIEVNELNVPCNMPESILLGSYLGVIARDSVLAPLSFKDWRNKGMEPFKKKMLTEVESKFDFPKHIRLWILHSLGVKWRNHKTSLKSEFWDSRPIEDIMDAVPTGVNAVQWCQLVSQWSKPEDMERAEKNRQNAKKQICPHTLGRMGSIRKQQETAIHDRLQLWKISRTRRDGTWSSEDAKLRWEQACEILSEEGLTPEDGNVEANERTFRIVMGPEHPGRVRTQGFGVTPTRYFTDSITTRGESSSTIVRMNRMEEEMRELQAEVKELRNSRSQYRPDNISQMGGHEATFEE